MTEVFMIALSNNVPLRFKNPADALRGLVNGKMTRGSDVKSPSQFSPMVFPDTVMASGWGRALFLSSSAMTAAGQLVDVRLRKGRTRETTSSVILFT
jgi:hypothetical protein